MFVGREDRLRVGLSYIDELVKDCSVDEVHLWNYTETPSDMQFVEEAASKPAYQLILPKWRFNTSYVDKEYKYREAYEYYRHEAPSPSNPRWVPRWAGAKADNTVMVKMDDDIVFLDVPRFACFASYVRAHKEKFLVSANVVNHPIADFYRTQLLPGFVEEFPSMAIYPEKMLRFGEDNEMGVAWGVMWSNASEAYKLHKRFTGDPQSFHLEDDSDFAKEHGECIRFAPPIRDPDVGALGGQGRMSINAIGIRWEIWDHVSDIIRSVPPQSEKSNYYIDETALTQFATWFPNHEECIYLPLLVAHLSYCNQDGAEAALPMYERLLDDQRAVNFNRTSEPLACL